MPSKCLYRDDSQGNGRERLAESRPSGPRQILGVGATRGLRALLLSNPGSQLAALRSCQLCNPLSHPQISQEKCSSSSVARPVCQAVSVEAGPCSISKTGWDSQSLETPRHLLVARLPSFASQAFLSAASLSCGLINQKDCFPVWDTAMYLQTARADSHLASGYSREDVFGTGACLSLLVNSNASRTFLGATSGETQRSLRLRVRSQESGSWSVGMLKHGDSVSPVPVARFDVVISNRTHRSSHSSLGSFLCRT